MWSTKEFIPYFPIVLILIILILIHMWALRRSNYWKNRNIPNTPALPYVGNLLELFLWKKSSFDHIMDMYFDPRTKNEPVSGYHLLHKPALFIREPALIKKVLVQDFHIFTNR